MSETVGEKLDKKQRVQEEKCNICGHPSVVTFQEKDEETGKMETKSHVVGCIGHIGVPDYLWNKSPDYTKFKQFEVRHKQLCSKLQRKGK